MTRYPALRTSRLTLRAFRTADAESVLDCFSREITTRFHNLDVMKSLDEARNLVEKRASLFQKGIGIRWAVTPRPHSGRVIGSVGFYNLQPAHRSAEIGYDLHPDYWSRGIATEAAGAAIDHGYGRKFFFPLNRIEALTYPEHRASIRVLPKLGFTDEGIRRECGFWKGASHDLRCLSLLRSDWEDSKLGSLGRSRAGRLHLATPSPATYAQR